MRFVVDANLSPKVAGYLQAAGHDAVHVVDVDLQHASDLVIMNWARTDERVVLSSDTDFGTLLARFEARDSSFLLLRHLNDRKPDEQAALVLANLDAVAELPCRRGGGDTVARSLAGAAAADPAGKLIHLQDCRDQQIRSRGQGRA